MATTTATAVTGAAGDDFAQPVYMDQEVGGSASPANGPGIDLNDPNLLSAEEDSVVGIDPYAAPPPLPDGRWLVHIKQRDVKGQDGQPARYKVDTDKNGAAYAFTALDATVVDPSGTFDGIKLSDYFVSTQRDPRKGNAVKLEWILQQLKVQIPAKRSPRFLLDEFFKMTASEPLIEIDTVWEGSLDQADQERFEAAGEKKSIPRVLGQHRFPQDSKGNPIPDMDVETKLGKVHLRARPRINGYFAVGSAKASGVEYGPKGR